MAAHTVDHPEFLHISRKGNMIYCGIDEDRLVTISVAQIMTLGKVNAPRAARGRHRAILRAGLRAVYCCAE
jgi:hypothetical protein